MLCATRPCAAADQPFLFGWDPLLSTAPRPSPLPIGFDDLKTFHQRLVQLPEGGLELSFVDLLLPAGAQPLVLKRQYRSGQRQEGMFGVGWSTNLDVRLSKTADDVIRIVEGDGRITRYSHLGADLYTSDIGTTPGSVLMWWEGKWRREKMNGEIELFDPSGRLLLRATRAESAIVFGYANAKARQPTQVADLAGHIAKLTYRDGLLVQVDYPSNRTVRYAYRNRLLAEVVDSVGRRTAFNYAAGKLSEMTLPDGAKLSFAYGSDATLRDIHGPGSLRTNFAWTLDSDNAGVKLTMTSASGPVQTLRIAPAVVAPSVAGPGVAGALGLALQRQLANGETWTSVILSDKILVANGKTRRVLDQNHQPAAAPASDAAAPPTNLHLWRTQLTPLKAPIRDPQLEYDALGRPTAVKLDGGLKESWIWDQADRITQWTDADGSVARYDYDALDRPLRIMVDGKLFATIAYDDDGRVSHVTDQQGGIARYRYDAAGNLVAIEDSAGGRTSYRYEQGRLVGISYPDGAQTTITALDDGRRVIETDAAGGKTITEYDLAGRVRLQQLPGMNARKFDYDSAGRLASESDASGQQVEYQYDGEGRLSAVAGAGTRLTLKPDAAGGLITTTAAGGMSVERRYDAEGRLLERRDSSGTGRKYEYDGDRVRRVTGSDGDTLQYDYDQAGNLAAVRFELNGQAATKRYKYDAARRPIEVVNEDATVEKFSYDAQGRLSERVNRFGAVFRYGYDAAGRRIRREGPFGVERFEYDQTGRLIVHDDPVEGVSRREYSGDGKIVTLTDPGGARTVLTLNESGQLLTAVDALGGKISYRHGAAGEIVARTDPNGNETKVRYDGEFRLTEQHTPAGRMFRRSYDARGRLVETRLPGDASIKSEYDAYDRLIRMVASDGAAWDYTYDARGRLTASKSAGGTASYSYDALDRLVGYRDAEGATVRISYDAAGRPLSVESPQGGKRSYAYNRIGLLESVADASGIAVRYTYDSLGRVSTIDYRNGTRTTYRYAAGRRVHSIATANAAGQILLAETYEYDARGNVTAIASEGARAPDAASDRGRMLGRAEFRYDALNRVTEAAFPDGLRERFIYDAAGNITQHQSNAAAADGTRRTALVSYAYDADQALTASGGRALAPDAAGNLCAERSASGCGVRYDAFGRLTAWRDRSYSYDGESRITGWRDGQGHGAHYVYAGAQLLEETRPDHGAAITYLPGAQDRLWAGLRIDADDYFPIRSANGSLLALTDKTGAVVQACRYRTFGLAASWPAASDAARCEFAGGRDIGPGFLFGSRVLSTTGLRFMTPDADGPDRDGNRYSYALDNPLRFVDLTGTAGAPLPPGTPMPQYTGPIVDRLRNMAAAGGPAGDVAQKTLDHMSQGTLTIETSSSSTIAAAKPGMTVLGEAPRDSTVARVFVEPHLQAYPKDPDLAMVRTTVHEATHVEQNISDSRLLGGNEGRRIHELEASLNEWKVDPTMGTGRARSATDVVNEVAETYKDKLGSNVMRERTLKPERLTVGGDGIETKPTLPTERLKQIRAEQAAKEAERVPAAATEVAGSSGSVDRAIVRQAAEAGSNAAEENALVRIGRAIGGKALGAGKGMIRALRSALGRAAPLLRGAKVIAGAAGQVLMIKDAIDLAAAVGRTAGEVAADLYLGLTHNRLTEALDRLANQVAALEKTNDQVRKRRRAERQELLARMAPDTAEQLHGPPDEPPSQPAAAPPAAAPSQPAAPAASPSSPQGPMLPLGQSSRPPNAPQQGSRPGQPQQQANNPPNAPNNQGPNQGTTSGNPPVTPPQGTPPPVSPPTGPDLTGMCGANYSQTIARVRTNQISGEQAGRCFCFFWDHADPARRPTTDFGGRSIAEKCAKLEGKVAPPPPPRPVQSPPPPPPQQPAAAPAPAVDPVPPPPAAPVPPQAAAQPPAPQFQGLPPPSIPDVVNPAIPSEPAAPKTLAHDPFWDRPPFDPGPLVLPPSSYQPGGGYQSGGDLGPGGIPRNPAASTSQSSSGGSGLLGAWDAATRGLGGVSGKIR